MLFDNKPCNRIYRLPSRRCIIFFLQYLVGERFSLFPVNCINVLQTVWIGGVRRMFRPISQNLKVTGMKGKVRGLLWSWNGDVIVHPEHTLSVLGLVIFCIRGKLSAKCFTLQKACIFAHISAGGSTIISSQNGFLSWNNSAALKLINKFFIFMTLK